MRAAGANGNGRLPAEYVAEYVELVTPATRWSPTARRWAPSGTTVPCSVWCQDAKRRPVPTESLPPGRTLPPTSLTASAYAALERLTGTGAISDYRPTHVTYVPRSSYATTKVWHHCSSILILAASMIISPFKRIAFSRTSMKMAQTRAGTMTTRTNFGLPG